MNCNRSATVLHATSMANSMSSVQANSNATSNGV
jgi:hypothetical protein